SPNAAATRNPPTASPIISIFDDFAGSARRGVRGSRVVGAAGLNTMSPSSSSIGCHSGRATAGIACGAVACGVGAGGAGAGTARAGRDTGGGAGGGAGGADGRDGSSILLVAGTAAGGATTGVGVVGPDTTVSAAGILLGALLLLLTFHLAAAREALSGLL